MQGKSRSNCEETRERKEENSRASGCTWERWEEWPAPRKKAAGQPAWLVKLQSPQSRASSQVQSCFLWRCVHRGWSSVCCPAVVSCCLCWQVLLKVLPCSSSARQGWLSGCSVSIYIPGTKAQHPIPGREARNYGSLASSRLERCNPFSLEANPLDLASLSNMLPSYKISFLSPSLLS